MDISTGIKSAFLALALTLCVSPIAQAGDNVVFTTGVVDVLKDGTVVVYVDEDALVPTNGHGLLESGQIAPGEKVDVKIVSDKSGRHRGHVTVLK